MILVRRQRGTTRVDPKAEKVGTRRSASSSPARLESLDSFPFRIYRAALITQRLRTPER